MNKTKANLKKLEKAEPVLEDLIKLSKGQESYKFQDVGKNFTLYVQKSFLKVCKNPEKESITTLLTKYCIFDYFHNLTGPAIIKHAEGRTEYWVSGRSLRDANPKLEKQMRKLFG